MPRLFTMPEVATGSDSATLSEWVLDEGATFAEDDVVATVETDKAVVDIQAEDGGVLVRRLVAAGTSVEVGAPIALLAAVGEDIDDVDAALATLGVGSPSTSAPDVDPGSGSPVPPDATGGEEVADAATEPALSSGRSGDGSGGSDARGERLFVSPLARRLAQEAELTLAEIAGSGPNGRIRKVDVVAAIERRAAPLVSGESAGDSGQTTPARLPSPEPTGSATRPAAGSPGAAGTEEIPHSRIRRAIARRLTESKQQVPHFYVRGSARVDRLLALRAELNDGGGPKVSVNDLIVKAVAKALIEVPEMNVTWGEDAVTRYAAADIAVAVATADGLVTPVLRGVERMPLTDVSASVADFAERARTGALRQNELEGGSFTVSNLGMYGTEDFTGIINPPHAGLLAVGAARPQPVVAGDGTLEAATVLHVTLSADHRPVDGVTGARWMRAFLDLLEHPVRILS